MYPKFEILSFWVFAIVKKFMTIWERTVYQDWINQLYCHINYVNRFNFNTIDTIQLTSKNHVFYKKYVLLKCHIFRIFKKNMYYKTWHFRWKNMKYVLSFKMCTFTIYTFTYIRRASHVRITVIMLTNWYNIPFYS